MVRGPRERARGSEPPLQRPSFADLPLADLDADQLEAVIRYHDHRYHALDDAEIPDQVYDALVRRLTALRPASSVLQAIGGGDGITDGERIEHRAPMLSLDKCYGFAELMEWAKDGTLVLRASPKIDGAAVSIRYDDSGRFELAATRGDGRRGEDIGRNVQRIPGVPAQLPAALLGDAPIEVRGEVYMPLSAFAEVAELFANPRNVAAGALKAKESGGVPSESLRFFAYDLLGAEVASEAEKSDRLHALGFTPAPSQTCTAGESEAVFAHWEQRRAELDYETDGVVFKIDDVAMQRRLGVTGHHPRFAIAWKFQGDSGESTLAGVEWSVSRTGTITPVALVEPVALSGATISRATLHNLSNVERLSLRIGDTLLLTRRGGVIPHVEGSRGGGDADVVPPAACPGCGAATEVRSSVRRVAGEDVETRTLHCSAPGDCPPVLRAQLFHYTAALEIDGFGPKILDALLAAGLLRDAADLYRLRPDALLALPRMAETSANKLVAQVAARRQVPLPTFLVALGIETLGRHAAQLLASRYTLAELRALPREELAAIHSLGELTAERIAEGLRDAGPLIDRLLDHVEIVRDAPAAATGGALAGEVVVFTGKLERMGRRDAQQLVTRLGGVAGSSVTAETTLLVVGGDELSADPPSSKLKKARKLAEANGTLKIVAEADFFDEVQGDAS